MATDAVGDADLDMASFTKKTSDALRESMPDEANIHNPVDVIGDARGTVPRGPRNHRRRRQRRGRPRVGRADADDRLRRPRGRDRRGQRRDGRPRRRLSDGRRPDPRTETATSGEGNPVTSTQPAGSRASRRSGDTATSRRASTPTRCRSMSTVSALARSSKRFATATTNRLGVEAMELLDAYGIPTPAGEIVDSPSAPPKSRPTSVATWS